MMEMIIRDGEHRTITLTNGIAQYRIDLSGDDKAWEWAMKVNIGDVIGDSIIKELMSKDPVYRTPEFSRKGF